MSEPAQKNSLELTWNAIKALISLFVTPLSIIAVIFIWDIDFCRYLFGLITKDNYTYPIYTIAIYCTLAVLVITALVVLLLTIFSPDNLIYDKEASLRKRGIAPFGQDGLIKGGKEKTTTPTSADL